MSYLAGIHLFSLLYPDLDDIKKIYFYQKKDINALSACINWKQYNYIQISSVIRALFYTKIDLKAFESI